MIEPVKLPSGALYFNVQQGSDSWSRLRMGRPTSSDFDSLITPTGEVSKAKGVKSYAHRLIAEILLQTPIRTMAPSYAMERGKALEPEARDAYCFITNEELEYGGFITDDLKRWGCSPDALIKGKNAGIEIKCPLSEEIHMGYLFDNETLIKDYAPQVQGQIFAAGFDYVDMISYYPGLPRVIVRVEPNPKFQASLETALLGIREYMNDKIEWLVDQGYMDLPKDNSISPEVALHG